MDTSPLDKAKYVSLTSYKRDGTPVSLPIWLAGSGGTYEMMTEEDSWKVKRLRNDPRVQLRVSDMRGRVADGARVFEGSAEIIDGPEAEAIQGRVWEKYGIVGKILTIPRKVMGLFGREQPAIVGIRVTIT